MTTIKELIRRGDHAYTVHDYFTCTKEEWQTLKAAVLAQLSHNNESIPCCLCGTPVKRSEIKAVTCSECADVL